MKQSNLKKFVFGFLIFVGFFLTVYTAKIYISNHEVILAEKKNVKSSISSVEEILLIYIGSSTCVYCTSPELKSSLNSLVKKLEKRATKSNKNLNIIGLTKESAPISGIKHLVELGVNFDEFSSGNRWRNISLDRYINDFESIYSTPQILLTKRIYEDTLFGDKIWNPIIEEKVIARYVGLNKITEIDLTKLEF